MGGLSLNLKDESADKINHMQRFKRYYEPGVLDYEKHNRLVLNLPIYAESANIPEWFIYNPTKHLLTPEDIEYLGKWSELDSLKVSGGVMVSGNITDRMFGMAGILLRNFIAARYITLQELVALIDDGEPPQEQVVLIPNFASKDKGLAHWEAAKVLGWLMDRGAKQKQTIIHAPDKASLSVYGGSGEEYITSTVVNLG